MVHGLQLRKTLRILVYTQKPGSRALDTVVSAYHGCNNP